MKTYKTRFNPRFKPFKTPAKPMVESQTTARIKPSITRGSNFWIKPKAGQRADGAGIDIRCTGLYAARKGCVKVGLSEW